METENNVKPKKEKLNVNTIPKPSFELDVSMLSEEAYKQQKQQKQQELIRKANQPSETTTEYQLPPQFKFDINQIGDYLLFLNEALEEWSIPPLTDEEMNQITDIVNEYKGFSLSQVFNRDPQSRNFIKSSTKAWKIWKVLKNILYPRIKPYLVPFLQENVIPYLKEYFKIKMDGLKNEQIEDGLSI